MPLENKEGLPHLTLRLKKQNKKATSIRYGQKVRNHERLEDQVMETSGPNVNHCLLLVTWGKILDFKPRIKNN